MSLEINKVKLSGDSPCIIYSRFLPSGNIEECKLKLTPVPDELVDLMQGLQDECINVLGLDPDQWSASKVTGLTLKHDSDSIGFCATLGDVGRVDGTVAINVNTPYLKPDLVSISAEKQLEKIAAFCERFIESQPKQMSLLELAS